MRLMICTLALGVLLGGCTSAVSELVELSGEEAQQLSDNVEESIDIQQKLSEFTFLAATGGLQDIENYDYTPPDASNDWTGTISQSAGTFGWGNGDLVIQFKTTGDQGPVDPYDPAVNLYDDQNVVVESAVSFLGTSQLGYNVAAAADFVLDTTQNGPEDVTTLVNGSYDISHGNYTNDFDANDVELGFNLTTHEITSMTGNMAGSVDIPNFAFDADFNIEGLGSQVDIAIDAAVTEIHYVKDLVDL